MSKEEILDIGENGYNVDQLGCVFLKDFVLKAMDIWAKQEAIGFMKWYAVKMMAFVEYITKIKPLVNSEEIELGMKEFEGKTFDQLYNLYLESKK